MADALPVVVPEDYEKSKNRDFEGTLRPISDNTRFSYGTAGFRSKAEDLTFIAFRLGYLAGLRARQLNQCIGVMITASHNPACDNGIKIVDPMGEMLAGEWEKHATNLVNQSDEQFPTAVRALEMQVIVAHSTNKARIVCGVDTRASGAHLRKAIVAGAALLVHTGRGVQVTDHGILTTPQLHYIARCENDPDFGVPTAEGYYEKLSGAFNSLLELTPSNPSSDLILDCANGVGALSMRKLQEHLKESILNIKYVNEDGELNHGCGADFVKIGQKLPSGFEDVDTATKCASFDGDADRLVYFRRTTDSSDGIALLDGDRIAVLITKYVKEQLDLAGLTEKLSLGIVQTAYANGASTKYIQEHVGVQPACVPTGVKHLHHEACKYDIGIYFEANGHGTIVFSRQFDEKIRKTDSENMGVRRLKLFSNVINEVVGDALADLLAVELILRHFGWSIEDWEKCLYTDLNNVQIKVPVMDRSVFKTTWEETSLTAPAGLQEKIEGLVAERGGIRAFVRPSGTENIVRVYAESSSSDSAQQLGDSIADLIRSLAV